MSEHAATYHGGEYTPSTRAVRETFAYTGQPESTAYLRAAFDRWLDQVHAEAWDEGHAAGQGSVKAKDNPYKGNR